MNTFCGTRGEFVLFQDLSSLDWKKDNQVLISRPANGQAVKVLAVIGSSEWNSGHPTSKKETALK